MPTTFTAITRAIIALTLSLAAVAGLIAATPDEAQAAIKTVITGPDGQKGEYVYVGQITQQEAREYLVEGLNTIRAANGIPPVELADFHEPAQCVSDRLIVEHDLDACPPDRGSYETGFHEVVTNNPHAFDGFMHSDPHARSIMNPAYDRVRIGTPTCREGGRTNIAVTALRMRTSEYHWDEERRAWVSPDGYKPTDGYPNGYDYITPPVPNVVQCTSGHLIRLKLVRNLTTNPYPTTTTTAKPTTTTAKPTTTAPATCNTKSPTSYFESRMTTTAHGEIWRLYQAYFLRQPDVGGFDFWMENYYTWTLPRISDYFAASPEFQERYGQLDNGEFVDLIYANVMCRTPDAGGRAYWADKLAGGMSRGRVMSFFSDSAEYKDKTKSG